MKTESVSYLYEVRNRQWPQIVQLNHVWLKFEVKVHGKKRLLKAAEALEEKNIMENVPTNIVLEDHYTKRNKLQSFYIFTAK